MPNIEIAFLGPSLPPFTEVSNSESSCTVEVSDRALISEVIDNAAAELGLGFDPAAAEEVDLEGVPFSNQLAGIGLARGLDETQHSFDVLDASGRLWWLMRFQDVSVGQLVQACNVGLLEGDP